MKQTLFLQLLHCAKTLWFGERQTVATPGRPMILGEAKLIIRRSGRHLPVAWRSVRAGTGIHMVVGALDIGAGERSVDSSEVLK